jgi:hypothetical protein
VLRSRKLGSIPLEPILRLRDGQIGKKLEAALKCKSFQERRYVPPGAHYHASPLRQSACDSAISTDCVGAMPASAITLAANFGTTGRPRGSGSRRPSLRRHTAGRRQELRDPDDTPDVEEATEASGLLHQCRRVCLHKRSQMVGNLAAVHAGPCNTGGKDAGSGPTPGYTGQTTGTEPQRFRVRNLIYSL